MNTSFLQLEKSNCQEDLEVSKQELSLLSPEYILDAQFPLSSTEKKMRVRRTSALSLPWTYALLRPQMGWWQGDHSFMQFLGFLCHQRPLWYLLLLHRSGDFQTLAPFLFRYQGWFLSNQSAPLPLTSSSREPADCTSRTGQTELKSGQISA